MFQISGKYTHNFLSYYAKRRTDDGGGNKKQRLERIATREGCVGYIDILMTSTKLRLMDYPHRGNAYCSGPFLFPQISNKISETVGLVTMEH